MEFLEIEKVFIEELLLDLSKWITDHNNLEIKDVVISKQEKVWRGRIYYFPNVIPAINNEKLLSKLFSVNVN